MRAVRFLFPLLIVLTGVAHTDEAPTREEAGRALRKAVGFFREHVTTKGTPGGYLWRYSADLKLREGEEVAKATTAWLQPPGTPTVGEAFLDAYEATGDRYYLDAARETAHALAMGQLRSGGWDNLIEYAPEDRARYAYRVEKKPGRRNRSTLDDDKTQSATRFLMRADKALGFKDATVHDSAMYALDFLVRGQHPNGGWSVKYDAFPRGPDPEHFPVKKASYPETWSREWERDFRGCYTTNDNLIPDMIDVMLLAADVYGDKKYLESAEKAGGFIRLAQMPDPQPGWAQQYDRDMHPVWARKFEPPAITGGESQGLMRALLLLSRRTGKKEFLEPLPRALAYYRKSQLPDGRLARFYELKTNKPLYFTRSYELTYKTDDLPTHYGFIVGSRLDAIGREYQRLAKADPKTLRTERERDRPRLTASLARQAKGVIDALDDRGAWVEEGRLRTDKEGRASSVIECRTFVRNVGVLCRFLRAER
jgi:hypothetical protein